MSGNILAIDLGGTRLRAGLAALENPGGVSGIGEWPAPTSLADFSRRIADLLAANGASHLGIGVPGLARETTCVWVPNLPYLDGVDLRPLFPKVEIALGNDAQFALLAEAADGAAQGMDDAILLAIGTGIGSAVLAGGNIVRGNKGGACSFGWAAADIGDAGDERDGWLERQASGRALDRLARLLGLADGAALIRAARSREPGASAALDGAMASLGTALAGAVALLDPQAIILAGGLARETDIIVPPIQKALNRHLPPHLRGIAIKSGRHGSRAGLVGAAFAGRAGTNWGKHHG